jgi:hypothetical protein
LAFPLARAVAASDTPYLLLLLLSACLSVCLSVFPCLLFTANSPAAAPVKMSSTKVYGPVGEIRPFLDHSITTHYMTAIPDQGGKIIAGGPDELLG